ncbi:hypothetical protein QBC33DRAFT_123444 [Phialemonium atrogriseum]|uniref:Uncharacterized protein n=1 Tax=Phialemonium atrogriseum TaxID=1093897 RepID=A0AAJ0BXB9_9PEZI|nr:uncharacterized protein QBC33DRAFT_123444 [Phialemonium atrogriseum]KAK1766006.1 hypothetical protein QBC33DRAFT_123444 [Phialemonium atrogriseum]
MDTAAGIRWSNADMKKLSKRSSVMGLTPWLWTMPEQRYIAAQNGRLDLLRLFLNYPGFDIDLEDNNGRTALFHAAMRGHDLVVSALLSRDTRRASEVEEEEPFVGPLFGNLTGNVQDCFGALPIFAAARNGHTQVVETLLFADPSCLQHKDWFGHKLGLVGVQEREKRACPHPARICRATWHKNPNTRPCLGEQPDRIRPE